MLSAREKWQISVKDCERDKSAPLDFRGRERRREEILYLHVQGQVLDGRWFFSVSVVKASTTVQQVDHNITLCGRVQLKVFHDTFLGLLAKIVKRVLHSSYLIFFCNYLANKIFFATTYHPLTRVRYVLGNWSPCTESFELIKFGINVSLW